MSARLFLACFFILNVSVARADMVVFDPQAVAQMSQQASTMGSLLSTAKDAMGIAKSTMQEVSAVKSLVGGGISVSQVMGASGILNMVSSCNSIFSLGNVSSSFSLADAFGQAGLRLSGGCGGNAGFSNQGEAMQLLKQQFSSPNAPTTTIPTAIKNSYMNGYAGAAYQQSDIANAQKSIASLADAAANAAAPGADLRQQLLVLSSINLRILEELVNHRDIMAKTLQVLSADGIGRSTFQAAPSSLTNAPPIQGAGTNTGKGNIFQ